MCPSSILVFGLLIGAVATIPVAGMPPVYFRWDRRMGCHSWPQSHWALIARGPCPSSSRWIYLLARCPGGSTWRIDWAPIHFKQSGPIYLILASIFSRASHPARLDRSGPAWPACWGRDCKNYWYYTKWKMDCSRYQSYSARICFRIRRSRCSWRSKRWGAPASVSWSLWRASMNCRCWDRRIRRNWRDLLRLCCSGCFHYFLATHSANSLPSY